MLIRLKGFGRFAPSVANVSEKEYNYSFQIAAVQKIHPLRNLLKGTDRLLLTPHLIALADYGNNHFNSDKQTPELDNDFSEDAFANKLLSIIKYLYYQRQQYYFNNLYKLINDALQSNREAGSSTLTLAALHPKSGDIHFYYIGDSLYGIFKERNVVMVQSLCESFQKAIKIGQQAGYTPENGYSQSYSKKQILKDDVIVIGSNGLWNNVHLDLLHYHIRGPGSFNDAKQFKTTKQVEPFSAKPQKQVKSLKRIAQKVGNIGAILAKRGNYESPIFLQAQKQKIQYPKQGFLDDVSVILAKRKREVLIKRSSEEQ